MTKPEVNASGFFGWETGILCLRKDVEALVASNNKITEKILSADITVNSTISTRTDFVLC